MKLDKLTALSIDSFDVTDEDLQALAVLKNLTELSLDCFKATDPTCKDLGGTRVPTRD